jgi:hypothetical protein
VTTDIYWTVKHNWDGYLWPRLWPNKRFAWKALCEETGRTRKQIETEHDWSLVKVRLVEVKT